MSTEKAREERDRVWAATYASYFAEAVFQHQALEGEPDDSTYEAMRKTAARVASEAVKGYYGRSMRCEEKYNE